MYTWICSKFNVLLLQTIKHQWIHLKKRTFCSFFICPTKRCFNHCLPEYKRSHEQTLQYL